MEWIQECFNSEACSGADNTEDGSERRRRLMMSGGTSGLLSVFSSSGRLLEAEDDDPAANATYGEALCAEGHTGLLCSVCVRTPVAYQGGGDNTLCTRCEGGSLALAFVPFILFVIFLILILIMFCRIGSGKDDGTSSGFVQASAENITASASDGKDLGKIAAPALEDMGNTTTQAAADSAAQRTASGTGSGYRRPSRLDAPHDIGVTHEVARIESRSQGQGGISSPAGMGISMRSRPSTNSGVEEVQSEASSIITTGITTGADSPSSRVGSAWSRARPSCGGGEPHDLAAPPSSSPGEHLHGEQLHGEQPEHLQGEHLQGEYRGSKPYLTAHQPAFERALLLAAEPAC